MRTRSFILAIVFLLAGPSWTGFADAGLPGIGTFSYNGSSPNAATPHLVVAGLAGR
jgi:hypothetical protein